MVKKLIAGNWKMNGLRDSARALIAGLLERAAATPPTCELLVCPPAPLLVPVAGMLQDGPIALGAQDCHAEAAGAHTGDVSAVLLADVGCRYVIVGHSERRQNHGETCNQVRAKAEAAKSAGLRPIVCIGETEDEREAGRALAVVETQLCQSLPDGSDGDTAVIAYEPVWAIGTGKTATPVDVAEVHQRIRGLLVEVLGADAGPDVRILYGGSVKPDNAAELLAVANVDGALVGGASLKAEDFWAIAASCP